MTRTCRPAQTVKGIDVSYYQGTIDWQAAKNDGVEYAFIRVSDGTGFNTVNVANRTKAKTYTIFNHGSRTITTAPGQNCRFIGSGPIT